jgi:hypothetical protein
MGRKTPFRQVTCRFWSQALLRHQAVGWSSWVHYSSLYFPGVDLRRIDLEEINGVCAPITNGSFFIARN